jgi:hypothetical protein
VASKYQSILDVGKSDSLMNKLFPKQIKSDTKQQSLDKVIRDINIKTDKGIIALFQDLMKK